MAAELPDNLRQAHWFYNWGTAFTYGKLDDWQNQFGQKLWPDAEVFVDTLETACERGPNPTVYRGIERALKAMGSSISHLANENGIKRLRDGARLLLAADCSAFLDGNETGERWDPYKRWLDQLLPNDVVISFNYDGVVEKISGFSEKATVVIPGTPATGGVQIPRAPLYKLHGSVDWIRGANNQIERTAERLSVLDAQTAEKLVLGVPGPIKTKVAAELDVLWGNALSALKKAHAVVFMGYRFPPTDSEALQKLLGAIAQNEVLYLALHVVLGPGRSDDVVRMERLLEFAAENGGRLVMENAPEPYIPEGDKRYNVKVQPLYAQDFSTLFSRPRVVLPYWKPSTGVPL